MKKSTVMILSVAFILVGAAGAVAVFRASRQPVPDAKFRQVKPGMSGQAVREILGPPTSISSVTNDAGSGVPGTNWGAQWTYQRSLPWGSAWAYVVFTNDAVSFTGRDQFP